MLLSTGSRWDIAENKEFRELVLELNPAVQLPGEESIKKFAETKTLIEESLLHLFVNDNQLCKGRNGNYTLNIVISEKGDNDHKLMNDCFDINKVINMDIH